MSESIVWLSGCLFECPPIWYPIKIAQSKVLSIQSNLGMLSNYADVFSYVDMLGVAELYFNFVVDSDI